MKNNKLVYYCGISLFLFFSACEHSAVIKIEGINETVRVGRFAGISLIILKILLSNKINVKHISTLIIDL